MKSPIKQKSVIDSSETEDTVVEVKRNKKRLRKKEESSQKT